MKYVGKSVSAVLTIGVLCAAMLTACPQATTGSIAEITLEEIDPLPDVIGFPAFDPQVPSSTYYDYWKQASTDLENCPIRL